MLSVGRALLCCLVLCCVVVPCRPGASETQIRGGMVERWARGSPGGPTRRKSPHPHRDWRVCARRLRLPLRQGRVCVCLFVWIKLDIEAQSGPMMS